MYEYRPPGMPPDSSREAWDTTTGDERRVWLAKAREVGKVFESVGLALADRRGPPLSLSPDELERLAEEEHRRWLQEKIDAGWQYGPAKDPVGKTHPSMVKYEALPESERQKDRRQIRKMLVEIDAAGIRLKRESNS
jgi:hypothetical protein